MLVEVIVNVEDTYVHYWDHIGEQQSNIYKHFSKQFLQKQWLQHHT